VQVTEYEYTRSAAVRDGQHRTSRPSHRPTATDETSARRWPTSWPASICPTSARPSIAGPLRDRGLHRFLDLLRRGCVEPRRLRRYVRSCCGLSRSARRRDLHGWAPSRCGSTWWRASVTPCCTPTSPGVLTAWCAPVCSPAMRGSPCTTAWPSTTPTRRRARLCGAHLQRPRQRGDHRGQHVWSRRCRSCSPRCTTPPPPPGRRASWPSAASGSPGSWRPTTRSCNGPCS